MVTPKLRTPGLVRVQISQSHHLSFSRRLALTYWMICQSKPDYRKKNCSQGYRANCPTPSINIRRKDDCQPRGSSCDRAGSPEWILNSTLIYTSQPRLSAGIMRGALLETQEV